MCNEPELVLDETRIQRLRLLTRKLNQARRAQAKKIDILCNDLISAQKDFIKLLGKLSFVVDAYEMLTGLMDPSVALNAAAEVIKLAAPTANIVFFLLEKDSLQVHMFGLDTPIDVDTKQLRAGFTPELVRSIANCNKLCQAEDMFAMGLQGNLAMLGKIRIVAVPLVVDGVALGFVLLYCSAENQFTTSELEKVAAITPGLSRTLKSCQELSHSQDSS